MQPATRPDPFAALRFRDFRLFAIGNFISATGSQMLSVAIGWELYERTGSAFALGLVGLVQVMPVILFSLFTGQIADRLNRRMLVLVSQLVLAASSLGLVVLSVQQGSLVLIYVCLLFIGIARAFNGPAASALLSQTVPENIFHNAANWFSSSWQLAAMIGPALGGVMIAIQKSATYVYAVDVVAALIFAGFVGLTTARQTPRPSEPITRESLSAGLRFVWKTKLILATITLDLFAVLLGGATTLLPVFAKDILAVGPTGLGWLRAAPSIGAVLMAVVLVYLPPFRNAGRALLWAVGGFGLATIVFGASRIFGVSLLMLAVLGALDHISVVIRSTLLLTRTPDAMRGRVSAVNNVFIGASNELGGFESGLAAAIFGPVLAVVGGGVGTILVVIAVAAIWPEVRQFTLTDPVSE